MTKDQISALDNIIKDSKMKQVKKSLIYQRDENFREKLSNMVNYSRKFSLHLIRDNIKSEVKKTPVEIMKHKNCS